MDALVFADMTTGPTGQPTTFEDRLADIFARYERSGAVHDAIADGPPADVVALPVVQQAYLGVHRAGELWRGPAQ